MRTIAASFVSDKTDVSNISAIVPFPPPKTYFIPHRPERISLVESWSVSPTPRHREFELVDIDYRAFGKVLKPHRAIYREKP